MSYLITIDGKEGAMAERMTMEEMIDQYPDRWVAIRDVERDGPNILSGILYAVLSDDEIGDFEEEHQGQGLTFFRTTEGDWDGIISSDFVIEVN